MTDWWANDTRIDHAMAEARIEATKQNRFFEYYALAALIRTLILLVQAVRQLNRDER